MTAYVAFFRGINVGGNNMLPMKALPALLKKAGCEDAQTYIQSGNAVFKSAKKPVELEKAIGAIVAKTHGFEPRVLVLSASDLDKAIAANPFTDAQADHKTLHFFFLAGSPTKPDVDGIKKLKSSRESFRIIKRVFYFHAPDGLGKSKLAARVEKLVGVAATGRNWQTVSKVAEMLRALK